ncbi:MAG: Protein-arginine kinase [Chlamydiia bacterium]|nr:Protein-arginine kinase [Chlamydiia bacterium]
MSEPNPLNGPIFQHNPWAHSSDDIHLSTQVQIRRNIAPFKFSKALTQIERGQVFSSIASGILQAASIAQSAALSGDQFPMEDKELLYERFLLTESFEKLDVGKGFVVDGQLPFLALINFEDHIALILNQGTDPLEKTYRDLREVETHLGESLHFSFSPKLGYLTADPKNCGTGLIVRAYLHLPTLVQTGSLTEMMTDLDSNLQLSGILKPDEFLANMVIVENRYRLGVTEEQILKSIETATAKLVEQEKQMREEMPQESVTLLKDKVSRAYAVLAHSYQIETPECLSALSLFELGKALRWIEGGGDMHFSDLFFNIRRAHFNKLCGPTPLDELPMKRAEFLHHRLKETKLKI